MRCRWPPVNGAGRGRIETETETTVMELQAIGSCLRVTWTARLYPRQLPAALGRAQGLEPGFRLVDGGELGHDLAGRGLTDYLL
jgi:hypothetical protein